MTSNQEDEAADPLAASWRELCNTLGRVPELIEDLSTTNDPRVRAEGYRYMARLVRMALERKFEGTDLDFPRLLFAQGPSRKIGGDCPDAVYRDCRLDGTGQYRVLGTRGNAATVVFTINRDPAQAALTKQPVLIDRITSEELTFEADGSFEFWLGGKARASNWRPLPSDSGMLMIRQFFGAAEPSEPATLSIERVDQDQRPSPPLPELITKAIDGSRLFLEHIPRTWGAELHHLLASPNQLAPLAPERQARLQATPGGVPLWGSYRLGPGEALIVEFNPPNSLYWSLLAGGPWFESLDYRTHITHLNMDQAAVDEDGIVRVVVAHAEPGVRNWIETGGFEEGFLLLRYLGNSPPPVATCRVVPQTALHSELPDGTETVDASTRDAERAARRWSSDRRFEGL